MSEITFSSNADFVESGDLFKIMELRYSQSIYDDDGCYPAKQPVSNSLELIRWYRNCEVFLSQLSAEEKKCAPLGDNDYEAFEAELRGLVIDPDVFSNFGITEHNRACQEIYDVFKLKEFRALTLHSSLPTEEKLQDLLEGGCKLREKLKSSAWLQHRFNLSNDHQGLLSDLHEFLKITESTYCLAFDIEVTADQFHDNCSVKWLDRAKPIKRLFEEALEFILTRQGELLRFYVKLEENGVYGYRFHAVVFLRSLKLTEGAWLANFREQLQQSFSDYYLLDKLLKPRYTRMLEEFRNNRDLTEKIPSEDEADKLEQEILAYWKENNTFEKSVESRPADKRWTFLDGPPFVTGMPHYGSLLSSLPKDLFGRYWTMKGFRVRRVWGWDGHGLPIENKVENELKIVSKKDIEEKTGKKVISGKNFKASACSHSRSGDFSPTTCLLGAPMMPCISSSEPQHAGARNVFPSLHPDNRQEKARRTRCIAISPSGQYISA